MAEPQYDKKKINCLFIAVEADPLVKVGGLGDVAFALPSALRNLHPDEIDGYEMDVRIILPCHSTACQGIGSSSSRMPFDVKTALGVIPSDFIQTEIKHTPVYLIASDLIPQNTSVYTSDLYKDGLKFLFFSQAVLQLAGTLGWDLDILHANDWHTAIVPHLLKQGKQAGLYPQKIKSVLTIHNLPFMGAGIEPALEDLGIPYSDDPKLPVWARSLPLPMGMSASDRIVAVSPSYAKEILTPEYGNDLNNFLATRTDRLSGIINGLDANLWDPATDHELAVQFSVRSLSDRHHNKAALQKEVGLEVSADIPILAFIGRVDQQKGIDLIIEALRLVHKESWQAILLGTGNTALEKQALQLQSDLPDKVRSLVKFDSRLSRRIYGGSDILMMPSRYEPCGIAQMIAMRYGCVPLAHATGGLIDTITNFSNSTPNHQATGFLFEDCTAKELAKTIKHALKIIQNKEDWMKMQVNGMNKDFSWHQSALNYAHLYMNT